MIVAHLSAFSRNSHGIASPSVTAFKQVFLSLLTNYSPCRTQLFGIRARKIVRDTVDKKRLYSTIFDQEEMQQPTLYEVLVKQLYTIKAAPVKLALDNMEKLYNLINNPMDQVSSKRTRKHFTLTPPVKRKKHQADVLMHSSLLANSIFFIFFERIIF
jgi:hypothetical protein